MICYVFLLDNVLKEVFLEAGVSTTRTTEVLVSSGPGDEWHHHYVMVNVCEALRARGLSTHLCCT